MSIGPGTGCLHSPLNIEPDVDASQRLLPRCAALECAGVDRRAFLRAFLVGGGEGRRQRRRATMNTGAGSAQGWPRRIASSRRRLPCSDALGDHYGVGDTAAGDLQRARSGGSFRRATSSRASYPPAAFGTKRRTLRTLDRVAPSVRWPIYVAGEGRHPTARDVELENARSLGQLTAAENGRTTRHERDLRAARPL